MPDVQVSPALELRIEPGTEGVLRLSVVAPTTLTLNMQPHSVVRQGRRYKVCFQGTQTNLPKDATCTIRIKSTSLGEERRTELGAVPMKLEGSRCTIEAEFDLFEVGLFGKGQASFTVQPDFPFASECLIAETLSFNHPLDVKGLPQQPQVALGRKFDLIPEFSDAFRNSTLRLSIFRAGGLSEPKKQNELRYSTLEWTEQDSKRKSWRVGCAQVDGRNSLLTYLESKAGTQGFDLQLEVIEKTGKDEKRYVVWDRPNAVTFPRPKLTSFQIQQGKAIALVEGIDPGFKLPLELTLWEAISHELTPTVRVPVMNPLTRPVETPASSGNYSWQFLVPPSRREGKSQTFALLRIPKTLSGTDTYVPVSSVMDYDEQTHLPFEEDQLWLEPPPKKGQRPNPKQNKLQKELATAVASQEVKADERPVRTPHFGAITAGVRDNNLLVSIRLVGDAAYWKDAGPVFSLRNASGETEIARLTTRPSPQKPQYLVALFPMSDKQILGQTVTLRGEVTRPDAQLWGELVAAPPAFSVTHECVPRLGALEKHLVEITDATSYIQVLCRTHYIPNGKSGTTLELKLYEYFVGLEEPVPLTLAGFRYDLPKGKAGQCNSRGLFVGRIMNPDIVKKLLGPGRFKLQVCVLDKEEKVFSLPVPPSSTDFGGAPRQLKGTVIWGAKVSPAFRMKVIAICDELGINPDYLMACMAFETQYTFRADKQNTQGLNVYGLIQFTPTGSVSLGKTVDELKVMSELEQLDYVKLFMSQHGGAKGLLRTLSDVYMAIICPAAVGKPEDYVCYSKDRTPNEYAKNRGLDPEKKGHITKANASIQVTRDYKDGETYRQ